MASELAYSDGASCITAISVYLLPFFFIYFRFGRRLRKKSRVEQNCGCRVCNELDRAALAASYLTPPPVRHLDRQQQTAGHIMLRSLPLARIAYAAAAAASLPPAATHRVSYKAGIPRRRHGHRHRLAQHGYNLTSDTRYFLARILAGKSATMSVSHSTTPTSSRGRSCRCRCRRRGMPA